MLIPLVFQHNQHVPRYLDASAIVAVCAGMPNLSCVRSSYLLESHALSFRIGVLFGSSETPRAALA